MPPEVPRYRHEITPTEDVIAAIVKSAPEKMIRIQHIPPPNKEGREGKIHEMWGIVTMNRLPFIFRAWPVDTTLPPGNGERNWFVHTPGNPSEFSLPMKEDPTKFSVPLFTDPIDKADKIHMLEVLGESDEAIAMAEDLDQLYKQVLSDNQDLYREFEKEYSGNKKMREIFGAAVKKICRDSDRAEKRRKAEELRKRNDSDTIKE